MANTISITEKPVAETIGSDAYLLGLQENSDGAQALYRMPLSKIAANINALSPKTHWEIITETSEQTQFTLNLSAANEDKYYFVCAVRVHLLGGDELLCDLEITDGSAGTAGQLEVKIKLSEPISGALGVTVVYTEGGT